MNKMEPVRKLSNAELFKLSNEQSKKLTRESIVTALVLLFAEKPYDKITVTDIAKKAGVSRTAFYSNFENKEDVVKEFGKNVISELNSFFSGERYDGNGRTLLLDVFNAIKQNPERAKLLFGSRQVVYEILGGGTVLDSVMPIKGKYDVYNYLATEAALKKIIIEWYKRGMNESPEDMAEYCSELSKKIIIGGDRV